MRHVLAALLALLAGTGAGAVTHEDIVLNLPGGARLEGTLTTPAGPPVAAAVLVPGSGPTDRDGNNPLGVAGSPYRMLAEALAGEGMAVLRYDKRGLFGSAGQGIDPNDVTVRRYAGDALGWADGLSARFGLPCVHLIGHSEGGLVALAAVELARRSTAPERAPCGVALVAAPGRPLGAIIREQVANAEAGGVARSEDADRVLRSLEGGARVPGADVPAALRPLFSEAVQGFLIDVLRYDPADLVARIGRPVLVVHGAEDVQVGAADADRLATAGGTLVTVPAMSHVLKRVEGTGRAASLSTYADPDAPLAPGLVDALASFLRETASSR